MRTAKQDGLVRVAAVLALVSLALVLVSLVAPWPGAMLVVMTAAEAAAAVSVVLYGYTVLRDLRRAHLLAVEELRRRS
jgi:hypothetical protein